MPDGVHTIPVPRGWSPEQAWEAIQRGEHFHTGVETPEPSWANVLILNGRFVQVYWERPVIRDEP